MSKKSYEIEILKEKLSLLNEKIFESNQMNTDLNERLYAARDELWKKVHSRTFKNILKDFFYKKIKYFKDYLLFKKNERKIISFEKLKTKYKG